MGRQNEEENRAFIKVAQYLEENGDNSIAITLCDLVLKMVEYLDESSTEA